MPPMDEVARRARGEHRHAVPELPDPRAAARKRLRLRGRGGLPLRRGRRSGWAHGRALPAGCADSWITWRPSGPSRPASTATPRSTGRAPGRSTRRADRYWSGPSRPASCAIDVDIDDVMRFAMAYTIGELRLGRAARPDARGGLRGPGRHAPPTGLNPRVPGQRLRPPRAAARAARTAFSACGRSTASVLTSRDTTESEVTGPRVPAAPAAP